MEKIYNVCKTIVNESGLSRVKSRIVSKSARIWTVIAPMLFIAFGLFGVNESAWAYWHVAYYCSADAYVRPANTGYVWVTVKGSSFNGNFSQGEHDDSNHDDAIWGGGLFDGDKKAPLTYGITAQFYAKAENGDYKFKGWYNNEDGAGTAISTNTSSNCSYSQTINATKTSPGPNLTLYAIYAKYKTTTTTIDFGDVAYKSAAQNKTFTIDCHNVGTWSSPSGLSSVLSAALSGNSDNNTQQTCTVTVTLDPKTAGIYNQTLTVSTSRGGYIQVTVKANVTATPTYTWNTDVWNANGTMKRDVYVGETINNVVSTPSNGTKTYSISGFTPSGTNNDGASTPTFTNNTLSCTQAGTLTLHINQAAEANGFEAGSSTVSITIKKRSNTLYANGDASYAPTICLGTDLPVTLTATNTDYTNCPIELVAQTAGDNTVAVFDYTQGTRTGTVHSKYKKDVTATWSIHQDENYKYLEANNTFSVDVKTASENTCYVLENQSNTEKEWHGNTCHEHTWNEENVAGELKFDISKDGGLYMAYRIQQLVNGNWQQTDELEDYSTSWQTKTFTLNQAAKGVRFYFKGGSYSYVRNVSVKRKTYVDASDLTIDKTSTNNPVYPSDGIGVGTLTIDYSLANGGNLKIYNDNPSKFTLLQSEVSVPDCSGSTANINIQYQSAVAGTDYAHLVIYNDVYRKEVTITGITSKRTQVINWEVGDVVRLGSETENAAWVVTGNPVSYSSSDPSIIDVVDGKLVAKAVGSATITATADGNGDYEDASDTKAIAVTNDEIQWIEWNQTFLRLKLGGGNITLAASAQSDVAGCTTNGARLITYSSADESVVRIVNTNQLQIIGDGTTVITATQAGGLDADGHKYMAVSQEKTVIVRDPNAPCENYLYIQPNENEWYCGWNHLNRQYKEFVIDNLVDPSNITLQYKGEYKRVAGVNYFYGTIHVEEWYDNDWHDITDGGLEPSIGSYQTFSHALTRNATKVRISTHDGVGYHYFKDCKIGQARYIETNTLSAYEAKVGQTVNQTLSISYDNIVGDIDLTLGHSPSNFSVSQNVITGDCGDRATVDITVSYTPAAATVGEGEAEVLTISDGTTTTEVNLRGKATVTDRYISWDIPEQNNKYTVESVALTATALTTVGNNPAGDVFYTKGGLSTTGTLDGTTLTFANAGVVYVSAQGVANAAYSTPAAVTKQFNVTKTPTTIDELPAISGTITAGTAANAVVLTGGSAKNTVNDGAVSGSFKVTAPATLNAGTYDLTIEFTPDDENMYARSTTALNVTISQLTPEESELGVTAGNITYGQRIDESILTNTGSMPGTWYWVDEAANHATPAADTYNDLNVYFVPEDSNYETVYSTVSVTVNELILNEFTGIGDWHTSSNWKNSDKPEGENPDVIISGQLIIGEELTVGSMTIKPEGSVTIVEDGKLTVIGRSNSLLVYGDVHVRDNGALILGNSADLQVRHFTLDAKLAGKNELDVKETAASGQVENPSNLSINGDAYFQMTFDPKGKISFGWYDFVVPFPVNISDGIFREGDLENHLVSGVDFIIQEYSESRCANNQKAWTNFYGTMQPGRVYTITFNYDPTFDQNVFVFKKASGAIGGPASFATQYTEGSGDTDDFGWNGIGNGMLQHGYISGAFAKMQVYNHAENKYDVLTGANPTFAVGTSFFVQVDGATPTMTWVPAEADEEHPLYAPKRETFEVEEFLLSLREQNHVDASDHLYISGSEEATEAYVIGRDLRKMGNPTEAKTAQMWATKNGKKLCDIETRMVNYGASSDLNFFAPQAGTFELKVEQMPEDVTLYLTYNGLAIWNLTYGPYIFDLSQGTTTGYGLRMEAKYVPAVTTGVEETESAAQTVRKVLIDDKVYIITPEGKMYDIIGKGIKF